MSKDDLGGFTTVDFASRAIFERGQAITPDNIRAYFVSDWPEKVDDPWYTDENIHRAAESLSELGLFEKSVPDAASSPMEAELTPEAVSPAIPTDYRLYKCEACGKMVLGFDRENHVQDAHKGKKVEWRKMK